MGLHHCGRNCELSLFPMVLFLLLYLKLCSGLMLHAEKEDREDKVRGERRIQRKRINDCCVGKNMMKGR